MMFGIERTKFKEKLKPSVSELLQVANKEDNKSQKKSKNRELKPTALELLIED